MRRTLSLTLCLSASLAGAYDLHTRALTPIVEKATPAGGEMAFVRNGKCDFSIVYDAKSAVAGKSAGVLADCFRKTTGTAPQGGRYVLKLAPSADPKDQTVSVRTSPDGVTLGGNVFYSALDFAERFLGVRWYYPGEGGTCFPKIADLTVRPVWYEDYPWFDGVRGDAFYVITSVRNEACQKHWEPYLGRLTRADVGEFIRFYRAGGRGCPGGSHNPRPERMAKSHPDRLKTIFYTSPGGKFWYNPDGHVGNFYNVLDLGFADLLIDDWKAYFASAGKDDRGGFGFDLGPDARISFGICDTYVPLSEVRSDPVVEKLGLVRESDLARDKDAGMCNVFARFYQYLGERAKRELPGHELFLLIYYNSKIASRDARFTLPDNIQLNVCDGRLLGKTRNPEAMRDTVRLFREWYEASGNRPVLKAWTYLSRFDRFNRAITPEFVGDVPKLLGKYLSRRGGVFIDYDDGCDMWHYFYAVYVANRLQWNPDFDADAAVDEMMENLFGPKAGPWMRKFHRELKDAYVKYVSSVASGSPAYPRSVIDSLAKSLDEAEKSLRPGTVEMRRFRLIADYWPEAFRTQRALADYEPPVYEVKRHSTGLDWAKLRSMPLVVTKSGEPAKVQGSVRLAWDEKGLYGRFETTVPPRADKTKDMWENDSLEILLCPGVGKEVLYQVAFDCLDREYAMKQVFLPIPQDADESYSMPGWTHASTVGRQGWSSAFFIPWAAFDAPAPRAYDNWNANIVRNACGADGESAGTAFTMGKNNNRDMFGLLRFCGRGD